MKFPLQYAMRAAARFASQLIAWFREHQRDLPWRRTRDPYAIWVSEIMLQQTQVKTVIPYWERWMRELPTIQSLATAKAERVLKLWEGLGYYSRARNLQKAAQQIVAQHHSAFPTDFEKILDLPGIGRYTAGAIASIAFGQPAPIVDGNVARVLSRYLGLRGDLKSRDTSAALWNTAALLAKAAHDSTEIRRIHNTAMYMPNPCGDLNQALMELGATICLPRNPLCNSCPVQARCYAWKNNKTAELPEVAAKTALTPRLFRAAVVLNRGKILMQQRPPGIVNAGFWELPNLEVTTESPAETFQNLFETKKLKFLPLCQIKHTITRYRMTLELFQVSIKGLKAGKWLEISDLHVVPVLNSHRKALKKARVIDNLIENSAKNLMEDLPTSATV